MQEMPVWSLGQEDLLKKYGNPLHYACLENPRHKGAWQAMVHGVAKEQAQLRDWTQQQTTIGIEMGA